MYADTTEQVVARRRSLGAEAANRPGQPAIDRDLLETLVDVVEASDEAEVSVEISGARVTVRRAVATTQESGSSQAGSRSGDVETESDGLVRVTSPMVGTFYRRPAPGQPPFVEEGQRVDPGETLCLIEAMKLFNEIVAEEGGVVRTICVEDASAAEFGQLLFLLEP